MDFNEYEYLCHHGIQGMKWGVRRYQDKDGRLTAAGRERYNKAGSAAHKIHTTAKNKEPEITKAVKSAGIPLYGIEHRLKTEQSIKRKILKGVDEEFMSIDDSAADIKDAVRYTTISSEKNFVDNYNKFKNKMEDKGYEEIRCKNNFELYKEGKVKHKSVQSVFEDRDGYKFEVQFQTPASQKAKDLKTPLYEERRKVGISETKAKILEQKMVDLAEAVKDPDRISSIRSYKKDSTIASRKAEIDTAFDKFWAKQDEIMKTRPRDEWNNAFDKNVEERNNAVLSSIAKGLDRKTFEEYRDTVQKMYEAGLKQFNAKTIKEDEKYYAIYVDYAKKYDELKSKISRDVLGDDSFDSLLLMNMLHDNKAIDIVDKKIAK